ncbi:preprotein translocase subunit SecE [Desertihabitans brevis]|uniref:Protein translocase subunit SecE n=1 Tax=Desertihabitans brevis TaxID=2268447 RepID=A0A367YVB8_9ACTN|nr:preprotein translocase subunit SecE [Desertihabitans brevis]
MVGARGSRRPVRRTPEGGETERKGRATRRRGDDEDDAERRTGPVTFVNESVGELRKVVWPTAEQMRTYFIVVLVFVVFMIALVSLLDLAFGTALLRLFS